MAQSNNSLQSRVNYDQIVIRTLEHQIIEYKKRIIELEKILNMNEDDLKDFRNWKEEKRKNQ